MRWHVLKHLKKLEGHGITCVSMYLLYICKKNTDTKKYVPPEVSGPNYVAHWHLIFWLTHTIVFRNHYLKNSNIWQDKLLAHSVSSLLTGTLHFWGQKRYISDATSLLGCNSGLNLAIKLVLNLMACSHSHLLEAPYCNY